MTERILIIDQGRGFGGTVVVAAMLMRQLASRGHHAALVSAAEADFARHRVQNAGPVYPLRPPYSYVEAGRLRDALSRTPFKTLARALNFLGSKLWALANVPYLWRLFRVARKERPTILHCNNYDNLEGLALAWALNIPCIMHAHGYVSAPGPVGAWLRTRLRCPAIAISTGVAQSVAQFAIPGESVTVLHNPVEPVVEPADYGSRAFRERFAISSSAVLVGIVGRVVRWKGQREFVMACLRVMDDNPHVYAVVVGDASDFDRTYSDEVRDLIAQSPHASRFRLTGYLADTHEVYRALDVLVHCSIEPEPFGLVITEAMAHGVPVIAADRGAPREIIEHGKTGLLRDPSDTAQLAAAIGALAADAALRHGLGAAGRAYATSQFSPSAFAARTLEVYAHARTEHAKTHPGVQVRLPDGLA